MDFNIGFLVDALSMFLGMVVGIELTDMTHPVTYEKSLKAVSKCKDGGWEKIGAEYLYCKDGAKYKLEK